MISKGWLGACATAAIVFMPAIQPARVAGVARFSRIDTPVQLRLSSVEAR
jgi:hypothetical protein